MQPHVPVVNCIIMIENRQHPNWYRRRSYLWPGVLAVIIVVPLLLVLFGTWDWFIPFVDARASAAIGRQVGMQHLHARLGRITTITAEGVHIANPTGSLARRPPTRRIYCASRPVYGASGCLAIPERRRPVFAGDCRPPARHRCDRYSPTAPRITSCRLPHHPARPAPPATPHRPPTSTALSSLMERRVSVSPKCVRTWMPPLRRRSWTARQRSLCGVTGQVG